jgi:hypothetical protein
MRPLRRLRLLNHSTRDTLGSGSKLRSMAQRYFEYAITARPWAMRGGGAKPRPKQKPKPFTVVARSRFEAELVFKAAHPRMAVISCTRGKQVDPPYRPA